jgi:two-component system phosphate regulon response regulator PhoB/two-component system alkaline phosphatase synthesis response regulator PhoP
MGRILIVDDEPQACMVLSRLVRHLGHESAYQTAGEAALSYVRDTPVDLMILDVMMPGMDGMEVLRRLRSNPQTASVPVVMFSAVADPNFIQEALRKGAQDYWIKASFDYNQLKERIEKLLPQ